MRVFYLRESNVRWNCGHDHRWRRVSYLSHVDPADRRRLWTTYDVVRRDGPTMSTSASLKLQPLTAASVRPAWRYRTVTSAMTLVAALTSHHTLAVVTRLLDVHWRHRTCVTSCPRDWCTNVRHKATRLRRTTSGRHPMTTNPRELAVCSRKKCQLTKLTICNSRSFYTHAIHQNDSVIGGLSTSVSPVCLRD